MAVCAYASVENAGNEILAGAEIQKSPVLAGGSTTLNAEVYTTALSYGLVTVRVVVYDPETSEGLINQPLRYHVPLPRFIPV